MPSVVFHTPEGIVVFEAPDPAVTAVSYKMTATHHSMHCAPPCVVPAVPFSPRQIRACLKCRSMRQRLYSPDRLKYPMKRVGERGDAKFERITWDEAFEIIARRWKEIVEKYGNESVY